MTNQELNDIYNTYLEFGKIFGFKEIYGEDKIDFDKFKNEYNNKYYFLSEDKKNIFRNLVIKNINDDDKKIYFFEKYKDDFRPYDIFKIINGLHSNTKKIQLLDKYSSMLNGFDIFEIINEIDNDDLKIQLLDKYIDRLYSFDIENIIINIKDEDKRLYLLKKYLDKFSEYDINQIIVNLSSDDKKIELIENHNKELNNYALGDIIKSIKDEDKKIQLINKYYEELYGYDLRKMIEEISSDEKKIVLLNKCKNKFDDDDIYHILMSLDNIIPKKINYKLTKSNSKELYDLRIPIIVSILENGFENYDEKLNKIIQLYEKNYMPIPAKIFKTYDILNKEVSKNCKSQVIDFLHTDSAKKFVFYCDLINCAIKSNDYSLREYIKEITNGQNIYTKLKNNKMNINLLNGEEKYELNYFINSMKVLFNNKSIFNDKLKEENLPIKKGTTFCDSMIYKFGHYIGVDSVKDLNNKMKYYRDIADMRGRRISKNKFELRKGDLIKGVGELYPQKFQEMLSRGITSHDFLGASSITDFTPLDTDLTLIRNNYSYLPEFENICYGPYFFVLRNHNNFMFTSVNKSIDNIKVDLPKFNPEKLEVFYTGYSSNSHYCIRTGFPSTNIEFIILNKEVLDENMKNIIAMQGFYIPIYNEKGKLLFSTDEYDNIRSKMCGLSKYDCEKFNLSNNLYNDDIELNYNQIEKNIIDTKNELNIINSKISNSLKFYGKIKNYFDGDLTCGYINLIDIGSTSRNTNEINNTDYDFVIMLDIDIFDNKLDLIKNKLINDLELSGGRIEDDGLKDYYLKLNINNKIKQVKVDFSFVPRRNKLNYTSEECLNDRLNNIKKQYSDKEYKYVLANIIEAKKILRKNKCYKSKKSLDAEGGLSGIGIENWILQNGGSLYDAASSFINASQIAKENSKNIESEFEKFKKNYKIYDFGQNYYAIKNNENMYDEFVSKKMNKDGYIKMKKCLSNYILKINNNKNKHKI